ncbi:MAG TPA: hypothetical protein VEJ63_11810 [Planctomycetota bacterium]|nr:hypothetical protein [Planctomycetota bacterium]
MSDNPRSFWRIHLSTLLITSLVAAFFIWLNVGRAKDKHGWPVEFQMDHEQRGNIRVYQDAEGVFWRRFTSYDQFGWLAFKDVYLPNLWCGMCGCLISLVGVEFVTRFRSKV